MRIHSSTPYLLDKWLDFFIFFQNDCYIYIHLPWIHKYGSKKNTLDMTLRQVDAHHIWWSASGLATFHQEPMFTFVAAQNHLNRSGQVCRSLQKRWKNQHPGVLLPISMNFQELFAFNGNVLNFRSFCAAAQLRNHQPTVAILEVLLLHNFLLFLARSVTHYILWLPS